MTKSESASTELRKSETCLLLLTSITVNPHSLIPLLLKPVSLPVKTLVMPVPPIPERMNKKEELPSSPPVCPCTSRPISSMSPSQMKVSSSTSSTHQVTLISPLKSPLPSELLMVPLSSSIISKVLPSKPRPSSDKPSVRRSSPFS